MAVVVRPMSFDARDGGVGIPERFLFWCPGCKTHMWFRTKMPATPDGSGCWSWNGDHERPTVNPSIVFSHGDKRCHLFIRDGNIEFLSDCTHGFAGKTIPMSSMENW